MKALLTQSFISIDPFRGYKKDYQKHLDFKQWIKDNQGKEVEIDTNSLFYNQYNTINGYRIHDSWIDSIKNDIRPQKTKCAYCGAVLNVGEKCNKYTECKTVDFSAKNTFFVAHPNGKDPIKKVDFKDHLKNERFYSCYSVSGVYYRISRRSNIHFVLAEGSIYIYNGIGYTPLNNANLSANEKKIVSYCADRINKL